jgi:hypothetical protein
VFARTRRHRLVRLTDVCFLLRGERPGYVSGARITHVREVTPRPKDPPRYFGHALAEGDEVIDHERGTVHR